MKLIQSLQSLFGKPGAGAQEPQSFFTARVRYVFLDVVDFTKNRTIEAQVEIVAALNDLVRGSISAHAPFFEPLILPTGDGMCICVYDPSAPYDVHLSIARCIINSVQAHNAEADQSRRFGVRIGINDNDDNLIIDINGRRNVAGAGINTAQRVMSKAGSQQIVLGPASYEALRYREAYYGKFRKYSVAVKHNESIDVYQYIGDDTQGLNTEAIPEMAASSKNTEDKKLSAFEAYYFAWAFKLRKFALSVLDTGQGPYAMSVMLYFLSMDSIEAKTHKNTSYRAMIFGSGRLPLEQVYEYYAKADFWLIAKFASYVDRHLSNRSKYFTFEGLIHTMTLINDLGKARIKAERPDICAEIGVDAGNDDVSARGSGS